MKKDVIVVVMEKKNPYPENAESNENVKRIPIHGIDFLTLIIMQLQETIFLFKEKERKKGENPEIHFNQMNKN